MVKRTPVAGCSGRGVVLLRILVDAHSFTFARHVVKCVKALEGLEGSDEIGPRWPCTEQRDLLSVGFRDDQLLYVVLDDLRSFMLWCRDITVHYDASCV